jgi:hypothetical protein
VECGILEAVQVIRGRSVPVLPESGRDLARTLWICLMILCGFIGAVSGLMLLVFIIRGHGL